MILRDDTHGIGVGYTVVSEISESSWNVRGFYSDDYVVLRAEDMFGNTDKMTVELDVLDELIMSLLAIQKELGSL